MNLAELIKKNRTYRRFDGLFKIERAELIELVDTARLTPSAANLQPLRFYLSVDSAKNAKIFATLKWAGYLEWAGPVEAERPSAYIVILADTAISKNPLYDAGIISQSLLLQAVDKGWGGCIFLSVNREVLKKELQLAEGLEIVSVIALGKPVEEVVIEELTDSVKYWRDENSVHHVPKRKLADLIVD